MVSERCDICLQNEKTVGEAVVSPLLVPLLHKHLGIIVLKDLVSCAQCCQLLELWDDFSNGAKANITVSHPACIFQPVFNTSTRDDKSDVNLGVKIEAVSPKPDVKKQINDVDVTSSSLPETTKSCDFQPLADSPQDLAIEVSTESETVASSIVWMSPTADEFDWVNPVGEELAAKLVFDCSGLFDTNGNNEKVVDGADDDVECDVCGSVFEHPSHLTAHIKYQHQEQYSKEAKTASCPRCVKSFPSYQEVLKHLLDSHVEQSPGVFNCVFCENVFTSKRRFDVHAKKHLGSTFYFLCRICSKQLATKELLKKHIQTHADPNYRPKKRNYVDPSYGPKKSKSKLRRDYTVCEYCYETFSKKNINKHIKRVHMVNRVEKRKSDSDRQYQCMICKDKFAMMRDLTRHTLSHTQERRPYDFIFQMNKEGVNSYQSHVAPSDLRMKISKNSGIFSCENNAQSDAENVSKCMEDENVEDLVLSRPVISPDQVSELEVQEFVSPKSCTCSFCNKLFYSIIAIEYHIKQSHIRMGHHVFPDHLK